MDGMLTQVAQYGFPMVVAVYLLVRVETKLELLSGSIQDLSKAIIEWRAHQS